MTNENEKIIRDNIVGGYQKKDKFVLIEEIDGEYRLLEVKKHDKKFWLAGSLGFMRDLFAERFLSASASTFFLYKVKYRKLRMSDVEKILEQVVDFKYRLVG